MGVIIKTPLRTQYRYDIAAYVVKTSIDHYAATCCQYRNTFFGENIYAFMSSGTAPRMVQKDAGFQSAVLAPATGILWLVGIRKPTPITMTKRSEGVIFIVCCHHFAFGMYPDLPSTALS